MHGSHYLAQNSIIINVKAVVAKSFERIYRGNLVGMGVLPLVFNGNAWVWTAPRRFPYLILLCVDIVPQFSGAFESYDFSFPEGQV